MGINTNGYRDSFMLKGKVCGSESVFELERRLIIRMHLSAINCIGSEQDGFIQWCCACVFFFCFVFAKRWSGM